MAQIILVFFVQLCNILRMAIRFPRIEFNQDDAKGATALTAACVGAIALSGALISKTNFVFFTPEFLEMSKPIIDQMVIWGSLAVAGGSLGLVKFRDNEAAPALVAARR